MRYETCQEMFNDKACSFNLSGALERVCCLCSVGGHQHQWNDRHRDHRHRYRQLDGKCHDEEHAE